MISTKIQTMGRENNMRKLKLILFLGLLSTVVSPSHGMTAAEILDRVRVNIADQSTAGNRQQFTDAALLAYLNDGQREANILGWLLQDRINLTLVSGTTEYALPADFLSTDRVLFNNQKLIQTSLSELDAGSPAWGSSSGPTPQKYYLYRTTTTVIGFVPAPRSPTITTIRLFYIKQPIELTSTSETPWNGWNSLTPYHTALTYYVTYRCYKAMQEETSATTYFQEWANSIEIMRKGTTNMPDFTPGFIGQRK